MGFRLLPAVFFLFTLTVQAAAAYVPPSALDIFKMLPATIFDNTPEGLTEEEKQTLIENSRTRLWRLISIDADELRVESHPVEGSSVTVRLFHGPENVVAAQGAEIRDACAVELWNYDARGRLVPYPLPADPPLQDFFAPEKKYSEPVEHSIRICLSAGVLRAWPIFAGPQAATPPPLENAVIYRWTGGGFEKAVLSLKTLYKAPQADSAEPTLEPTR